MIPSSENRQLKSEYEYFRRRFLKLSTGKTRATILLVLSVLTNIGCMVLYFKWSIITKLLVACMLVRNFPFYHFVVYFGSIASELYSIQLLVTIWKELNGVDEYTPYLVKTADSFESSPSSELQSGISRYNMTLDRKETNEETTSSANPTWPYGVCFLNDYN